MIGPIALTSEEQQLAQQIVFDRQVYNRLEQESVIANGEWAANLMEKLMARKVIPENRLRYFVDPEYNISNPKASKADLFLRNAGTKATMYRHGEFAVSYLRYFIFGADLPLKIKEAFFALSQQSFRDWDALIKLARKQAREASLEPYERPDAFYQLALDCGLPQGEARSIRDAVMKLK